MGLRRSPTSDRDTSAERAHVGARNRDRAYNRDHDRGHTLDRGHTHVRDHRNRVPGLSPCVGVGRRIVPGWFRFHDLACVLDRRLVPLPRTSILETTQQPRRRKRVRVFEPFLLLLV
jgi:hypothetical protein